jgi:hypothetical protein
MQSLGGLVSVAKFTLDAQSLLEVISSFAESTEIVIDQPEDA